MNNENSMLINLNMNNEKEISSDKKAIFKELIIKYLLNKIVGDNLNGT